MMSLDEVLAYYGDPMDPAFEATQLVLFDLPYAMLYNGAPLLHARCHRLAVERFKAALTDIKDLGAADKAMEFNGIYANRSIRGFAGHPSAHAWGLAIDLNASTLPLGSDKDQSNFVIGAFQHHGFAYGGSFKSRRDPMHFSLVGF